MFFYMVHSVHMTFVVCPSREAEPPLTFSRRFPPLPPMEGDLGLCTCGSLNISSAFSLFLFRLSELPSWVEENSSHVRMERN